MKNSPTVRRDLVGFAAWRGKTVAMDVAHTHGEVELNWMVTGAATYFLAGRFQSLTPNRLALFWAGIPHQLVKAAANTEFIWLTVPLAWLLQWRITPAFTKRLLAGNLIEDPQSSPADGTQLQRWVNDLKAPAPELRQIVLLELEARVRRLALAAAPQRSRATAPSGAIERMTQFIGLHYLEAVSVTQIAAAVRLHPNYATQTFKRATGMSQ